MLNITNGDSAVYSLREAGIRGEFLPWRDLLHEGPVPAGLTLEELSEVRARFIAACGWGAYDDVLSSFRERDRVLRGFRDHERTILWFEHDLYDQTQLLQLLAWFADQDLRGTDLRLICTGNYIGRLDPEGVASIIAAETPVTGAMLDLGRRGWEAFSAPDPGHLLRLIEEDTSALPFLAGALRRHLQQFPSIGNGLGRTESQILAAVASGAGTLGRVFSATQEMEERIFMGDTTLWRYIDEMANGPAPLLVIEDAAQDAPHASRRVARTPLADDIVAGRRDWIVMNGIDRWLGGVHLRPGALYRWDDAGGMLVRGG